MSVWFRIDDRLIHGQVVVGCCGPMSIRRLILARDEVAADPFQSDIYRAAVPPTLETIIAPIQDAADLLAAGGAATTTLVVVEGAADLHRLREAGVPVEKATLGGAHRSGARDRELVAGVFVGPSDLMALRRLLDDGVELDVQTVPGAPRVPLTSQRLDRVEQP